MFQSEEWSVDRVCSWLESLAAIQNSGRPVHPDDLRAGVTAFDTISHSLTPLSLFSKLKELAEVLKPFLCTLETT